MDKPAATNRGLKTVLLATAVAGGLGYLIQAVLPPLVTLDAYLSFTTFWSATYLIVSCLAGIQQELTRASRLGSDGGGYRSWRLFTLASSVAAVIVVVLVFSLIGQRLFPTDTAILVSALAVAAFGYSLIAGVSGALYGIEDWPGIGGMTIADSVLRTITLALALAAGGSAIFLGWAIAIPFGVAAATIWLWRGRKIVENLQLDVGIPTLVRNTAATLVAALATGVLISGLPFIIRAIMTDADPGLLAAIILVLSLTRAPLVIPLVALQGYLLVRFRDSSSGTNLVWRWAGALLGVALVLGGLSAWLGPMLLSWLYPNFTALEPGVVAAIVVSAGLTGMLCITGPAVLAASQHRWYVAGWSVSALAVVGVLLFPVDALPRIIIALVVAPILGMIVHAVCLCRLRRQEPASAST